MAIQITSPQHFQTEVIEFDGISIIDFWAEWCGPCRMLGPVMEDLSHENADKKVKIVKVNVDEQWELAGTFGISSIPAVFFVQGGKIVHQVVGVNPKGVYQNKIDELLAAAPAEDVKMAA